MKLIKTKVTKNKTICNYRPPPLDKISVSTLSPFNYPSSLGLIFLSRKTKNIFISYVNRHFLAILSILLRYLL